jgi:hypothetical protein
MSWMGDPCTGLTIVNPFRPDNDALVDHILPP